MNEDKRIRDKAAFFAYRDKAREIYEVTAISNDGQKGLHIKVPLHANVQMCEGGAFVEAVVWVPEKEIEP